MESLNEKILKITADILKSWQSNAGVVSPFSSSSSQHVEQSDNHLEHYVPAQSNKTTEDVASIFNSNIFTNGGNQVTDKALDVNSSTTEDKSYTNPGSSTTEPDPQSEIAITKSAEIPHTTVGTTANTTTEAPSSGETTEPMKKQADTCPHCSGDMCSDCKKAMTMCMCDGMAKAETVENETSPNKEDISKSAEEEETSENDNDEDDKDIKKSIWGGAFAPSIKRGL
jgi:hypothetical protein